MKAFQLIVEGNWAHFKKPETNNNPLTHDFITKTAFLGLVGAILGIERKEMKGFFPQFSEDLLYGVKLLNPVKKESWGFTLRKAINLFEKAPKQMEFLKMPKYEIIVALFNPRSELQFLKLLKAIKNSEAIYTPVLGLHNCPANLRFLSEGEVSNEKNGIFEAKSFVPRNDFTKILDLSLSDDLRIGFDRIPTYQDDNFWNPPDKYIEVIYPGVNKSFTVSGNYYEFNETGECWCLV